MKYFSITSLCVLAALASWSSAAFIIEAKSAEDFEFSGDGDDSTEDAYADSFVPVGLGRTEYDEEVPKHSRSKTKVDTTDRCCGIGDIGILIPIVVNGTKSVRHEAIHMIIDEATRCSTEDLKDLTTNSHIPDLKCNVASFSEHFMMLFYGTKARKAEALAVLEQAVQDCNAESGAAAGGKLPVCELNKKKWDLFTQWMVGFYVNKAPGTEKTTSRQSKVMTR